MQRCSLIFSEIATLHLNIPEFCNAPLHLPLFLSYFMGFSFNNCLNNSCWRHAEELKNIKVRKKCRFVSTHLYVSAFINLLWYKMHTLKRICIPPINPLIRRGKHIHKLMNYYSKFFLFLETTQSHHQHRIDTYNCH